MSESIWLIGVFHCIFFCQKNRIDGCGVSMVEFKYNKVIYTVKRWKGTVPIVCLLSYVWGNIVFLTDCVFFTCVIGILDIVLIFVGAGNLSCWNFIWIVKRCRPCWKFHSPVCLFYTQIYGHDLEFAISDSWNNSFIMDIWYSLYSFLRNNGIFFKLITTYIYLDIFLSHFPDSTERNFWDSKIWQSKSLLPVFYRYL